jgi:transposase-like protein
VVGKTIVMGMAERGGRTKAEVIPDVQKSTLREVTHRNVEPDSTVSTNTAP